MPACFQGGTQRVILVAIKMVPNMVTSILNSATAHLLADAIKMSVVCYLYLIIPMGRMDTSHNNPKTASFTQSAW